MTRPTGGLLRAIWANLAMARHETRLMFTWAQAAGLLAVAAGFVLMASSSG
jgi:hypothetical protein